MYDVIIIGAGPGGIFSAYELTVYFCLTLLEAELFVLLSAEMGLALGLVLPNLHWTSEAAVIKMSGCTLLSMAANLVAVLVLTLAQTNLLKILPLPADTVRGCGLAVTPQHLLTPRKSTTAILGIADHPVTGTRAGCATCHLKETCSFRKRGTTCFTQD